MKLRTVMVLGLFWIMVLALVSAGSVAAEGLYWGDSITTPGEGPGCEFPAADNVPAQVRDRLRARLCDKFVFDEPEITITSGLYWGD